MDKIRKIVREEIEKRDIVVTLPKSVSWGDYSKELDKVKDGKEVMNFKVRSFPKTGVGKRCYIVHNGFVRGWMEIVGMSKEDFICSTTGKRWSGKFIQRSGPFHEIEPIPMKGFQGFRYFEL